MTRPLAVVEGDVDVVDFEAAVPNLGTTRPLDLTGVDGHGLKIEKKATQNKSRLQETIRSHAAISFRYEASERFSPCQIG